MPASLVLPRAIPPAAPLTALRLKVRSADELRRALRESRDGALTLDGSGLDRVLAHDTGRGTIEVQAATPWTALAPILAGETVGDSVSRGAAGPDGEPIARHVVALTLVTPDGELRRADRAGAPELFGLVAGGQGVFGVLYSVTLGVQSLHRSAANALAPVEWRDPGSSGGNPSLDRCRCLVPPHALEAFLERVRLQVEERGLGLHAVTVRRILPDPGAFFAARRRELADVTIVLLRPRAAPAGPATLGARVAAAEVRRLLLAAAIELGGAFPLEEPHDATRAQIEACYPEIGAFLAHKRRLDPGERLQNDWYRALVARLRCRPCASRWAAA